MRSEQIYMKPGAGEQVQAAIPLPESGEALLSGAVTDGGAPAPQVLVVLLDQETGETLQHTLTDELGRFWFGPLPPEKLYCIRVQKPEQRLRVIAL